MFAGIIEGIRPIISITPHAGGRRFVVDLQDFAQGVAVGASIALNGVCLTATDLEGTRATFGAMSETLKKTTFGLLKVGDKVNIERSLKVGDRVDGHFVQGHVFGLGTITEKIDTDKEFKLWIEGGELMKYVAPVGSMAVNGVSLTVADVKDGQFAVALIPITLKLTNLGSLKVGDQVNLEPDVIARQVVHYLETFKSRETA
ncbi:MAG: riboflavin synthase [Candidatus Andersenbacteria bacterium]|nr:riboflavin synthase [Candidatus Andersenbacteria bacterium]